MSLQPPTPGLRRIHHDSRSAQKVTISVQPGDVLDVSDDVADQLERHSPQFKRGTKKTATEPAASPPAKKATAAKKTAAKPKS